MQSSTPPRAVTRRGLLRLCAAFSLLLAVGCSDDVLALERRAIPEFPSLTTTLDDGFDDADSGRWALDTHPLGRGWVRAANTAVGGGVAALTFPVGAVDGGEIRSTEKFGFGSYVARMKTPLVPGTLSAFFLYEGGSDIADELDIEIYNDGSRRIIFTTWVAGQMTNSATHVLPFDPAADFHDYRIEWSRRQVRFLVDGVEMRRWRKGVPQNSMYVMANAWWPTWLTGPLPSEPRMLLVDHIRAGR